MVKGSHNIHYILRGLMVVIYLVFLTKKDNVENVYNKILENHLEVFENHTENLKLTNALIVGGSNSVFGLSAEIISQTTQFNFYNLSIIKNGFNRYEYIRFIEKITSDYDRSKVELIIFSPIEILKPLPFENNYYSVNGLSRSLIENEISMMSYGFSKTNSKNQKQLTYEVTEKYGDFDFKNFNCDFEKSRQQIFHPASINDSFDYILNFRNTLQGIFKNAKIVIAIPSEFDPIPLERLNYLKKLNQKLAQNKVLYIDQSNINSVSLICDHTHHLNENGRVVRSLDLAKKINLMFEKKR